MKLLLDHNLSPKLIGKLSAEFGQVDHVDALGMAGDSDTEVWEYAKLNGYAIVSKDKDFYQRSAIVGQPPKVIHLTLGNCSVAAAASALLGRSGNVKDFLNHPSKAKPIWFFLCHDPDSRRCMPRDEPQQPWHHLRHDFRHHHRTPRRK